MARPVANRRAIAGTNETSAIGETTTRYAVVIERQERSNHSEYVPDLPGCVSIGDTGSDRVSPSRRERRRRANPSFVNPRHVCRCGTTRAELGSIHCQGFSNPLHGMVLGCRIFIRLSEIPAARKAAPLAPPASPAHRAYSLYLTSFLHPGRGVKCRWQGRAAAIRRYNPVC